MAQKLNLGFLVSLLVAATLCDAGLAQSFDVNGFLRPQNAAREELGLAPLQWDARLANYAQGWAAQRKAYGDCRLQHSGGPYGENIFWGSGKAWQPEEAANAWVSEKRWYRYYSNSCVYYNKCGHYTQVVWRGTARVGCARSACSDGNIFMTCNYYPPGNWVGQRPY
jgi:pathogenesis-related protein 1